MKIKVEEYARLLKNEVQGIKYKEMYEKKLAELKRSNDMVAYYEKMNMKLRQSKAEDENAENKRPFLDNVMLNM